MDGIKTPHRIGIAALIFWGFAVVLSRSTHAADSTATASERLTSVNDSFDWAEGIITSLGALAPAIVSRPLYKETHSPHKALRIRKRLHRVAPVKAFMTRHFYLQRSTAFGMFNLTVDETEPGAFDLVIGSDAPAENVEVEDRVSHEILVDRPLDDERVFRLHVPEAVSRRIAVRVSLSQADEIDQAYFPLLGSKKK